MTWTYTPPVAPSPGEPPVFAEDVSWVRYRVGDTVESPQSLSDEEIAFEIAQDTPTDLWLAASRVAGAMANRFLSLASGTKTVGNTSIGRYYNREAERYRDLADRLASQATGSQARSLRGMGLVGEPPSDPLFTTRQFGNR